MQLFALREYCERRGWEIAGEYVDIGWSGAKARRPELDRIMKDAGERRFDCILVWALDRFSRSMVHLTQQLGVLRSAGVRFIATTQSIDTDQANPASQLILHILGAVAEFERAIIRERVTAGVRNYQKAFDEGRIGRDRHSRSGKDLPLGGKVKVFDRQRAIDLRNAGLSIRAIARDCQVSVGTIHGLLKAKKAVQ